MPTSAQLTQAFNLLDTRFFGSETKTAKMLAARGRRMSALSRGATLAETPEDDDGIVGIGVGKPPPERDGTGELCLRVYVRKKFPLEDIPQARRVPASVGPVPVHVIEVGTIRANPACSTRKQRFQTRPVPCGISCGHAGEVAAGTLGARVRKRGQSGYYILSNNHVLAMCNRAAIGDVTVQPGRLDIAPPHNAQTRHHIGTLAEFVPLDFTGAYNDVDAAISKTTRNDVRQEICSVGNVAGIVTPRVDLIVQKHGRTTGHTVGVIEDVTAKVWVDYDAAGTGLFVNTISIRGGNELFSDAGDSGSLILDEQKRACGLLFAGSDSENLTFANPIRKVLSKLKIEFA